jgi:hypothetical protein
LSLIFQGQLVKFTDSIEKKLAYFNELPKITQKFSSASLSVYDATFKALLEKLDECIEFISKHVSKY